MFERWPLMSIIRPTSWKNKFKIINQSFRLNVGDDFLKPGLWKYIIEYFQKNFFNFSKKHICQPLVVAKLNLVLQEPKVISMPIFIKNFIVHKLYNVSKLDPPKIKNWDIPKLVRFLLEIGILLGVKGIRKTIPYWEVQGVP